MMFKSVEEQLSVIKRGTIDIVREDELVDKLKRSIKESRPLRVKLGLDPTAPDIHIGNAIPIYKLRTFQQLGHTAVLIIGDYTALVGDPTGVNKTRPLVSKEEVLENARTYLNQVGQIIDVEKAEIIYNSQWFEKMTFSDIIKLTSGVTVARIIERDDFAKRYAAQTPISLHEFLYPLMQAYDSVMVKSDIELGGTDQLFNLLLGRDLQRGHGQEAQTSLTTPLLEGTDGNKKMSKSLGNYIGITEPPEVMFGKAMSISDTLMRKYFELATDLSMERIDTLLEDGVHPRDSKVALGKAIVSRYHSQDEAERAAVEFDKIFREHKLPDEIPEVRIPGSELKDGKLWIVKLLTLCKFASTNGEARRLVAQGGVNVNDTVCKDPNSEVDIEPGMVLKVGKRRFARVVLED